MRIDFKQPKYVLPVILLPFLCVFFYIYQSTFAREAAPVEGKDSLQDRIADVSAEVKGRSLADKLQAYQRQFREGDGYTAIGQLQEEEPLSMQPEGLYNAQEKRLLDSIQRELARPAYGSRQLGASPHPSDYRREDRELAVALAGLRKPATAATTTSGSVDPMTLFRQQMALVDSMEKANNPEYQAQQARQAARDAARQASVGDEPLTVQKADGGAAAFNTIRPGSADRRIQAIVDESIKGYADSRLRIRLLDDILVGNRLIPQGTCLYAEVSGFSGQRVNLRIRSIMQGGEILPIRLDIYDHDGMPGLFVPASAFREFTRELGASSVQGVSLQQQAESNSQMVMSLVQRMFSSTTTAVSRQIRKNKANIKYNTLVFLVDPDQLHNR